VARAVEEHGSHLIPAQIEGECGQTIGTFE
jgi:hypothetical protein